MGGRPTDRRSEYVRVPGGVMPQKSRRGFPHPQAARGTILAQFPQRNQLNFPN
jgi:hypothetical protein